MFRYVTYEGAAEMLTLYRRSGIAGAGLSLYARLISHFNITNMVFNYI